MASIAKRRENDGTLRYRVRVRIKGRPEASQTFDTLALAREWAQSTEADIKRGLAFPELEAKRHTLTDAIERYRREAMPMLKASTRQSLHYLLKSLESKLGAYSLADLSPTRIVEYRAALLADGNGNASANRHMAALSAVLALAAREWGWLADNPVRKVAKLREPRGRVRYLSHDERTRLLAECKASQSNALYPVVVLALSTGARRGELLGLRWRDVNLSDGMLTFRGTKNGEDRTVPVQGLALDTLREWGKVRPFDADTLVFPSAEDRTRPASLREAFDNALDRAEISDFRWHDMRHDAASRLVMAGATLRDVQELLGHKTTSMTTRYAHLSPEHMRRVAEKAAL